jgi:hypothetical protein
VSPFFAGLESIRDRFDLSGMDGRIPVMPDYVRHDRTGIDDASTVAGYPCRRTVVHNNLLQQAIYLNTHPRASYRDFGIYLVLKTSKTKALLLARSRFGWRIPLFLRW